MRKIAGNDVVIDRMISGDNEIIYNLISLIRSDADAIIYTDDVSFLTAQSNPFTPIWICTNKSIDSLVEDEISDILVQAIEKNENVHIIGFVESLKNVFNRVSAKMLVGEISKDVMSAGLTPMLYADARNPVSNAVYQNIGYEKVGEVMEYKVSFEN